jgi:hypothetical protein
LQGGQRDGDLGQRDGRGRLGVFWLAPAAVVRLFRPVGLAWAVVAGLVRAVVAVAGIRAVAVIRPWAAGERDPVPGADPVE